MKFSLLLSLLFINTLSYAQDVELNKQSGIVSQEGNELFRIEREGINDYYFEVFDIAGKRIMVVNYQHIGDSSWMEFIFLESKKKVAVRNKIYRSKKRLAKLIIREGLVKDSVVDDEAANIFILTKEIDPSLLFDNNSCGLNHNH